MCSVPNLFHLTYLFFCRRVVFEYFIYHSAIHWHFYSLLYMKKPSSFNWRTRKNQSYYLLSGWQASVIINLIHWPVIVGTTNPMGKKLLSYHSSLRQTNAKRTVWILWKTTSFKKRVHHYRQLLIEVDKGIFKPLILSSKNLEGKMDVLRVSSFGIL